MLERNTKRPFFKQTLATLLQVPLLTQKRIWLAYGVALGTDILQVMLAPWLGAGVILPFDDGLDIVAMLILSRLLGFHLLFLPTFLIEFVPFIDFLPFWLLSVRIVIQQRKKEQHFDPKEWKNSV